MKLSAHNFNHITDKILNSELNNENSHCISTLTTIGKDLIFTDFYTNCLQKLLQIFPKLQFLRKALAKKTQDVLLAYNEKAFHDLSSYIKKSQGQNVQNEVLEKQDLIPLSMVYGEEIITQQKHRQILRVALIISYRQRLEQHFGKKQATQLINDHFTPEMQKGTQALPKNKREAILELLNPKPIAL